MGWLTAKANDNGLWGISCKSDEFHSIAKQIGINRKTWLTIKKGIEQFYLLPAHAHNRMETLLLLQQKPVSLASAAMAAAVATTKTTVVINKQTRNTATVAVKYNILVSIYMLIYAQKTRTRTHARTSISNAEQGEQKEKEGKKPRE